MKTSKRLFVYLQRPDNGEWVTVGRYELRGSIAKPQGIADKPSGKRVEVVGGSVSLKHTQPSGLPNLKLTRPQVVAGNTALVQCH